MEWEDFPRGHVGNTHAVTLSADAAEPEFGNTPCGLRLHIFHG